jgi:hypothetical protein
MRFASPPSCALCKRVSAEEPPAAQRTASECVACVKRELDSLTQYRSVCPAEELPTVNRNLSSAKAHLATLPEDSGDRPACRRCKPSKKSSKFVRRTRADFINCPVCGAPVLSHNLDQHKLKVHSAKDMATSRATGKAPKVQLRKATDLGHFCRRCGKKGHYACGDGPMLDALHRRHCEHCGVRMKDKRVSSYTFSTDLSAAAAYKRGLCIECGTPASELAHIHAADVSFRPPEQERANKPFVVCPRCSDLRHWEETRCECGYRIPHSDRRPRRNHRR